MTDLSQFMTIKDASELLGVTPLTLRNWDRSGKLKALRHPINNYRVYRRDEIEKFIFDIVSQPLTERVIIKKISKKHPKKLEVKHLD